MTKTHPAGGGRHPDWLPGPVTLPAVFSKYPSHQYDIAIGGAGSQGCQPVPGQPGPSYLYFAPVPVVRPGFFIIPARCQEAPGKGGEQRFLKTMRDSPSVEFILRMPRKATTGQQRAFVMAKVLEQARVVIVAVNARSGGSLQDDPTASMARPGWSRPPGPRLRCAHRSPRLADLPVIIAC